MIGILPYIELKDIYYSYPKGGFAIDGLSLELLKNDFTAITGPNGSGKTTLGKLISGIFKPGKGSVSICGKDTREMSLGEIGGKIGYLFQNPERQLFAPSVREEISFILELKGYDQKYIDDSVEYILEKFNLKHLENAVSFKLSRGEKQRLAIAAVLVNKPDFLVFDEPTTGLDMDRKNILSNMLYELMDNGIGMAVISHDTEFVKRHAARVIKLEGGSIIEDFTP